jgi:hypothetical protein
MLGYCKFRGCKSEFIFVFPLHVYFSNYSFCYDISVCLAPLLLQIRTIWPPSKLPGYYPGLFMLILNPLKENSTFRNVILS